MRLLFTPSRIGRIEFPGWLMMTPMTCARSNGDDGVPTDMIASFDAPRAGAGLIIGESAYPVVTGKACADHPAFDAVTPA